MYYNQLELAYRVANRPEFFRTVGNFLVLSGKRRLTFPDSTVSGKIVIVTVRIVTSSICSFYSSKQLVFSKI